MWRNFVKFCCMVSWLNGGFVLRCYYLRLEFDVVVLDLMKLWRYRCFVRFKELLFGFELLKMFYYELDFI